MILISHRGNLSGPIPQLENSPKYIWSALNSGFDVEIDVWFHDGDFWLGHDEPQYKVDVEFLINDKFWCHAKNIEALLEMKKYPIHYFWHESDKITLTSKNFIWAYPSSIVIPQSITLFPEKFNHGNVEYYGLCSDFIVNYKHDKTNYI